MSRQRKKYSKEEKLSVVKLSLSEDQTIQELADRFEISANTIYNWRSTYLKNGAASFPGNGNKMQTESERRISELEKELRETKLERDILKKAVGIFSRSDRKFSNL